MRPISKIASLVRRSAKAARQTKRAITRPPAASRHPEVSRTRRGGLEIVEIEPEVIVPVTMRGRHDSGYHDYGNDWWGNSWCPASFSYLSIDAMYPDPYFAATTGHPNESRAEDIVRYMIETYPKVTGRPLQSVLELGCGGGEITKALLSKGIDVLAVEGTDAGVRRLRQIGIPSDSVMQFNLKFLPKIDRQFDLVMCTEVAEHIEPFFASKIVDNCISHADYVWFSAADRNRAAHYHHLNEQDIVVWDNLFAHMGMPVFVELDGRQGRASRLYMRAGPTPLPTAG